MDLRPIYEVIIGLCFLSLIFSSEMWRKVHPSVGIAIFVLLLSGIYTFFFSPNYPVPADPFLIARGGGEVLLSMVTFLLFSSLLLFKPRKFFDSILRCLFFCAVLDSAVLIFNSLILKQHPPYAMLNNGTADAAFIVCLLPIAWDEERWFSMILIWTALSLTRSNTAFAGIGIGFAFFLLTKFDFKKWLLIMILPTLFLIIVAYLTLGNHFLADSGRLEVWNNIWKFFQKFANPWVGFGTGTFTSWGVIFQKAAQPNNRELAIWGWLHLEPLEILFENGIIGLLSILNVYFFILKRTFRKSTAFPIACVYAFTGLTEMPLRLFVTQMLGLCLLAVAFKPSIGEGLGSRKPIHEPLPSDEMLT